MTVHPPDEDAASESPSKVGAIEFRRVSPYQDVVAQGRHHETQRLGLVNVVLIVAAPVLSFVGLDQEVTGSDAAAGVFLFVLGLMGAMFSIKQDERFRFHMVQAREYRRALGVADLGKLRAEAKRRHLHAWDRGDVARSCGRDSLTVKPVTGSDCRPRATLRR